MSTATKNFHVPLPTDLYERLRAESKDSSLPATSIARTAIAAWLKQREREKLHQDISEYARMNAGTEMDLDETLEAATVEFLLSEEA